MQNQRLNMVRMFGSKREFQVQKFVRNRKGRTLSQDESERRHSALDGGHESVSSAVSTTTSILAILPEGGLPWARMMGRYLSALSFAVVLVPV